MLQCLPWTTQKHTGLQKQTQKTLKTRKVNPTLSENEKHAEKHTALKGYCFISERCYNIHFYESVNLYKNLIYISRFMLKEMVPVRNTQKSQLVAKISAI